MGKRAKPTCFDEHTVLCSILHVDIDHPVWRLWICWTLFVISFPSHNIWSMIIITFTIGRDQFFSVEFFGWDRSKNSPCMINDYHSIPIAFPQLFYNIKMINVLLTGPEQLPTNMKLAMITPVKVSWGNILVRSKHNFRNGWYPTTRILLNCWRGECCCSHLTHEYCIDFPDEPPPHCQVTKTPIAWLEKPKWKRIEK